MRDDKYLIVSTPLFCVLMIDVHVHIYNMIHIDQNKIETDRQTDRQTD